MNASKIAVTAFIAANTLLATAVVAAAFVLLRGTDTAQTPTNAAVALVALRSTPAATRTPEPTSTPVPVTWAATVALDESNCLNVRDASSLSGKVLTCVKGGTTLRVLCIVVPSVDGRTWYRVVLPDGRVGYAAGGTYMGRPFAQ